MGKRISGAGSDQVAKTARKSPWATRILEAIQNFDYSIIDCVSKNKLTVSLVKTKDLEVCMAMDERVKQPGLLCFSQEL